MDLLEESFVACDEMVVDQEDPLTTTPTFLFGGKTRFGGQLMH